MPYNNTQKSKNALGLSRMKLRLILITISALLMSLSFHPLGLHFLAWFGLIPLLFAIENATASTHFKTGLLFGFLFSLFSLFWIVFLQIPTTVKILMIVGMIILFLYIGLYFGTGLLIAKQIGIWFLPFVIAGLEFVRGFGEIGFPWLSLGYTQARYPLIIQQASLYGIYGVSFWLVLLNVALYTVLTMRTVKYVLITGLIFLLPLIYGIRRMKQPTENYMSIGVIQPDIDPNLKFDRSMKQETFRRLLSLTVMCADRALEQTGNLPELIIWPETATPVFLTSPGRYQDLVVELADRINVPVFSGTPLLNRTNYELYNGAVLIEPGKGVVQEYKKIHLVPFGEHIPFDRYVPLFRKINLGEGDYAPGSEYTVFRTNNIRFSCLICFESIFPELSHVFVKRGAELLVNITNDGWFGKISGPQQHNDMAILRTVENGVPLARSANNGISMVVDQYGRVLKETTLFEEDFIFCNIPADEDVTLYRRFGYVYPVACLILVTLLLIQKHYIHVRK